jgi:hypothetical protein
VPVRSVLSRQRLTHTFRTYNSNHIQLSRCMPAGIRDYKRMPGPLERQNGLWLQVMQSPTVKVLAVTLAAAVGILLILIWPQGALHVRFQAPQAPTRAESTQVAASTDPFCKFMYNIPNWEGQDTPVCDTSICKGREKLRPVQPPAAGSQQRRWSAFDEATYLKLFEGNQISGWLQVRPQKEQRLTGLYAHVTATAAGDSSHAPRRAPTGQHTLSP